MIKYHYILFLKVFLLTGCAIQKPLYLYSDYPSSHPSVKIFLDYANSIDKASVLDESIKEYFIPSKPNNIDSLKGWSKLVYTSSFSALSQGQCKKIFVTNVSTKLVLLNCVGEYYEKVFQKLSNIRETMHLRVYLRKIDGHWFIGRSGLTHTTTNHLGQKKIANYGLRFPKSDYLILSSGAI